MAAELEVDRYCFVCGPENSAGLQARFEAADGRSRGSYLAREEHQGYTGLSHGGIVAALLDEAMVYAAVTLKRWVATAEMTVRYHQPAPIGALLEVTGEVVRHRGRLVECRAELRSGDLLIASATGKVMQSRPLTEEEASERKIG